MSHQVEWRDEVRHHFEKIKSEGTCLHRLDEELIKRRREELRLVDQSETIRRIKRFKNDWRLSILQRKHKRFATA